MSTADQPADGERPPGGRRRSVTPALIVAAVLGTAVVALVGLMVVIRSGGAYSQDLAVDQDDFLELDEDGWATYYARDGLHVLVSEPGTFAWVGVRSAHPHTALSIEASIDVVTAPIDASIGPMCLHEPAVGFGFTVDGNGVARLLQFVIVGNDSVEARTLAQTMAMPSNTAFDELSITCAASTTSSTVELVGRVDGQLVLTATPVSNRTDFSFNGVFAHAAGAAPAEWVIRTFERSGS